MAKPFKQQRFLLPALQDLLHDVGCQEREAQDSADVALGDFLGVADVADGGVDALVEHALPAPCPGERLQKCAVRLRFRGRHDRATVR
jgi:hypothetical protein